jgi:hypothetical protein
MPDCERGNAISEHGVHQPAELAPSPSALRRALARARDGKALDQAEAAILLHARGDDLRGSGTPGWRPPVVRA